MAIPPILTLTNGTLPSGPQFWLDAAQAAVRAYCGWHVSPVIIEPLVLDGSGARSLLIPSNRVLGVSACTNDDVDVLAGLQWSAEGVLTLPSGWTYKLRGVTVTVEHGYEEAPDVAGVIASVASRASINPSGVIAQGAGSQSVRYSSTGASIPLLLSEKETLAPYKLNWGI